MGANMNRRSFLERVALTTAIVPALERSHADAASPAPPASEQVRLKPYATSAPTLPDLLTLRRERGLLRPCPNCGAVAWQAMADPPRDVVCSCGWIQRLDPLISPCPCADCRGEVVYARRQEHGKLPDLPRVEHRTLVLSAPVGLYLVQRGGRDVTRVVLNEYDVCEDEWLHRAEQVRVARVRCAVFEALHPVSGRYRGFTVGRQINGNLVIQGWDTVDCDEWKARRRA